MRNERAKPSFDRNAHDTMSIKSASLLHLLGAGCSLLWMFWLMCFSNGASGSLASEIPNMSKNRIGLPWLVSVFSIGASFWCWVSTPSSLDDDISPHDKSLRRSISGHSNLCGIDTKKGLSEADEVMIQYSRRDENDDTPCFLVPKVMAHHLGVEDDVIEKKRRELLGEAADVMTGPSDSSPWGWYMNLTPPSSQASCNSQSPDLLMNQYGILSTH